MALYADAIVEAQDEVNLRHVCLTASHIALNGALLTQPRTENPDQMFTLQVGKRWNAVHVVIPHPSLGVDDAAVTYFVASAIGEPPMTTEAVLRAQVAKLKQKVCSIHPQ